MCNFIFISRHVNHFLVLCLEKMIRLGKVRTGRESVQIRLSYGDSASVQERFRRNIMYIHYLERGVKKMLSCGTDTWRSFTVSHSSKNL